jgi:large subunit ribosomal protein L25
MDAKLIVTSRDSKGSANARRMRREGVVPGVIYTGGKAAREISLPKHAFEQMLHHHAGEQMMVAIELHGKDSSVLLKDVQHDMMGRGVVHVDFMEVSMTEKLKVEIAVELVGDAAGVVTGGGVLDHSLYSLDVACLPGDILEKIEVDVADLEIGGVLCVKDIQLDAAKYEILTEGDIAVATILAPRVAVDEGEEDGEGSEGPEVITEKNQDA